MASSSSSWAAPSIGRYRPAILALTALAAGCTIYYIHKQIWSLSTVPKASLQRSNARRQRRRPHRRSSASVRDIPWGTVPVSLDFLADASFNQETFGDHLFLPSTGDSPSITTPLRRQMPSEQDLQAVTASNEEASTIRRELEEAFLCLYLWKHVPPSPLTDEQQRFIVSQLGESGGFQAEAVTTALQWHQAGVLTERIHWWERLI